MIAPGGQVRVAPVAAVFQAAGFVTDGRCRVCAQRADIQQPVVFQRLGGAAVKFALHVPRVPGRGRRIGVVQGHPVDVAIAISGPAWAISSNASALASRMTGELGVKWTLARYIGSGRPLARTSTRATACQYGYPRSWRGSITWSPPIP
jgi:hypothetical protein